MVSAERLSALIGLIYDAALDARRWPTFLDAFADAVGGTATQLLYHDLRQNRGGISMAIRLDPEARRKYDEHFGAIDPWITAGRRSGALVPGSVCIGEELVPRNEFAKTEYYSDLARPYGLARLLGAVICLDDSTASSISSLRSDCDEPFGEGNRELVLLLMPHLQRAMQVHRRVAHLELSNTVGMDALDRLQIGVIVTREDATILFANSAATAILNSRDGLTAPRDGLRAAVASEHRALRLLLQSAAATSRGLATESGGAMSIARPSLRRPFSVLVTPGRTHVLGGFPSHTRSAVVFVTDPERVVEADIDTLRRLWGLTPAEAQIASRLAAGRSLREVSEELSITNNTSRWHLKQIFTKTETRRQAELVRVLSMSATTLAAVSGCAGKMIPKRVRRREGS